MVLFILSDPLDSSFLCLNVLLTDKENKLLEMHWQLPINLSAVANHDDQNTYMLVNTTKFQWAAALIKDDVKNERDLCNFALVQYYVYHTFMLAQEACYKGLQMNVGPTQITIDINGAYKDVRGVLPQNKVIGDGLGDVPSKEQVRNMIGELPDSLGQWSTMKKTSLKNHGSHIGAGNEKT